MRVAVVGSRNYENERRVKSAVRWLLDNGYEIVSGGAPGPDSWAEEVAEALGHEITVHEAEWDRLGKRAGFERNTVIVDDCDWVIAFWDGKSRGTEDTIRKAVLAGKVLHVNPIIGEPWT